MLGKLHRACRAAHPRPCNLSPFPSPLGNARLSLSLLRMCKKAPWASEVRLQAAVGRMRNAWVIGRSTFSSNAQSRLRMRSLPGLLHALCLDSAHALQKYLPVHQLLRERGGAGARLRWTTGTGQGFPCSARQRRAAQRPLKPRPRSCQL